jgi:hypothetical protein
MSEFHQMQRESVLISQIRERLPEFAGACASDVDVVLLHQDAFATDYRDEELQVLGYGNQIRRPQFEGSSRDWLESTDAQQRGQIQ